MSGLHLSSIGPIGPVGPVGEPLGHDDTLRLLDSQSRILELIAAGTPLPDVLAAVLATLEDLLDGTRCSILLLDRETGTLRHGAAPSLPLPYVAAIDGLSIGRDAGSCGTAAFLGVPVVAEDVDVDPRWDRYRGYARPHGLRSCWSTPIHGRAGIVGTFAVYTGAPHRPTPREVVLVERLTHLASVAIDHAGLFGALTESEERFRRAFEDNAVGMALTELDGRFVKVNAALVHLLRRTEAELLATTVHEVLGLRSPSDAARLDAVTRGARGSAHLEATSVRPDGTSVHLAVAASAVRTVDGVPRHVSVNVADLTARDVAEAERRARREADIARESAEAANRAKTEFLSALSHELRTPLQAVRGFVELLRTLDLAPQRRAAALEHIDGASAHVTALVDDLLDVARIEAGSLPVDLADVDVVRLFRDVRELLEPLAAKGGVVVRVQPGGVGGPDGATVVADERRLRQVLINLVTNAIRYNRADGSVTLSVAPGHTGWLALRVADTGQGIPPELRERLFVPFDRLGRQIGSDGGIGLGLSLARGLTEAMGGRIGVASSVGVGTTVTVSLPTT